MTLKSYLLNRQYEKVEGWLADGAAWLTYFVDAWQKAHGVRGDVAEIGVHHGKYFILLSLLARDDERTIAIDVFENQQLNVDSSGRGDYAIFTSNLRSFDPRGQRLVVHKADSLQLRGRDLTKEAAPPVAQVPRTIRIFSVDGCHTAEHTRNDILVAFDAIGPNGVVIVDDFYNPHWPGVQEGVHKVLLERSDIAPVAYGENKLLLCRSADYPALSTFLESELKEHFANFKAVEMHGRQVHWYAMSDPRALFDRDLNRVRWRATCGRHDGVKLIDGWAVPEQEGCWTNARSARLVLDLQGVALGAAKSLRVSFSIFPFVHKDRPQREVVVSISSGQRFAGGLKEHRVVDFVVPQAKLKGPLEVRFETDELDSPAEVDKSSGDTRRLGLFVSEIKAELVT